MSSQLATQFMDYLHRDLNVSEEAIDVASRQSVFSLNQFPIVLWQLGFVSLEQLDNIFDWLEASSSSEISRVTKR